MVRVYVNSAGLAQTLVRSNYIKAAADFSSFGCGFTQCRPLFDFVDVGGGKERADHKIRGTFDSNPTGFVIPFLQLIYKTYSHFYRDVTFIYRKSSVPAYCFCGLSR